MMWAARLSIPFRPRAATTRLAEADGATSQSRAWRKIKEFDVSTLEGDTDTILKPLFSLYYLK